MIRPMASLWSSIWNFPYHPFATIKHCLGEIFSNVNSGVDVATCPYRNKVLCETPPMWYHNVISWWRHIQNIKSFQNLELDTLSNIKTTGRFWLSFVFFTSWDENTAVSLAAAEMSGELYHVTTQFYYVIWQVITDLCPNFNVVYLNHS